MVIKSFSDNLVPSVVELLTACSCKDVAKVLDWVCYM